MHHLPFNGNAFQRSKFNEDARREGYREAKPGSNESLIKNVSVPLHNFSWKPLMNVWLFLTGFQGQSDDHLDRKCQPSSPVFGLFKGF